MVKENYTCPRCDYKTKLKSNMHRHLYLIKLCPATNKDIDFNDDVKQYILDNRTYKNYKKIIYNNIFLGETGSTKYQSNDLQTNELIKEDIIPSGREKIKIFDDNTLINLIKSKFN